MYTVTEDISLNGEVVAYRIYPDGELKKVSTVDAGGTSTCYITIGGEDSSKLVVANYWNSTLVSFPLDTATGEVGEAVAKYDPLQGKAMKASAGGHVNHSDNDASTIAERQVQRCSASRPPRRRQGRRIRGHSGAVAFFFCQCKEH